MSWGIACFCPDRLVCISVCVCLDSETNNSNLAVKATEHHLWAWTCYRGEADGLWKAKSLGFFCLDAMLNFPLWPCLCYFLRLTAFSKWPASTRDVCLCLTCFRWSLWMAFLGHLLACGSSKIVYWALLSKPFINQSAHFSPECVWCGASSGCGIRSRKLLLLQVRNKSKKEGLLVLIKQSL